MNTENMLRVADAIEEESIAKFNMGAWVGTSCCGTVACVAGFATLLEPGVRSHRSWSERGEKILGLTDSEAEELFYGGPHSLDWLTRQKKLVPDAIRWMALTGEVSWRKAIEVAKCVSLSKRYMDR